MHISYREKKTWTLMLYRELMAVGSEVLTKYRDTLLVESGIF
jgi:hypothetical protein